MFAEPGRGEREHREGDEQYRSQGFRMYFSHCATLFSLQSCLYRSRGKTKIMHWVPSVQRPKWFAVFSKPTLRMNGAE